ncbi:DUF6123 family protein [Neobacillus vireti]|uniref:DUF6123 family protein n=1 Tax=Neobacillus vireti TaxID=220686 RepID=UPI002FFEDA47
MLTVEDYLHYLRGKGFHFQDDAVGFIFFGKHYTNATDEMINTAIEITLKAQKRFDGSFYVALLEMLTANNINTRKAALKYVKENELFAI